MAKAPSLKVYVTSTGFHDAYVAAPSKAAALRAWGSGHDLFARGVASLVTDPALMEAPLATPGQVVKRLRGTTEEQLAALPPDLPKAKIASRAKPPQPAPPDRTALDNAEKAVADQQATHDRRDHDLAGRIAALQRERKAAAGEHTAEASRLIDIRDRAAAEWKAAEKAYTSARPSRPRKDA